MNSKKIGVALLVFSIIIIVIFLSTFQVLETKSEKMGCFNDKNCQPLQIQFSLINLGFGLFGFILALGVYLIFFNKGEQAILEQLQHEKEKITNEERFSLLLKGLDSFEQTILKAVREQPGITQNTLRLRVDLSKAKLSQVLTNLEKKGLVKRNQQGKTLAVHCTLPF